MPDLILSPIASKACTKCGEVKQAGLFGRNPSAKSGLRSHCKQCVAAFDKIKNDKLANHELRAQKAARKELINSGVCQCIDCKLTLPLTSFSNIASHNYKCTDCQSSTRLKWSQENRERDRQTWASQGEKWKDRKKERNKIYREANQEDLYAARRQWYQENKDSFNKKNNEDKKQRLKVDPVYAMRIRIKDLISLKIRAGGYTKKSSSQDILGCDWEFFKLHIERQFLKGMNWENRAQWHLDHLVPISTATSEEEVIALNHFTNLRPMWAKDNLAKGAQITHLI